ncbi:MAG: glycosyltransferase [Candidatus Nitrosocaldus sp.]
MMKEVIDKKQKIAVLIPCYNEEKTIAKVVSDFCLQLPDAEIYVCDNNSIDNTVKEAKRAGARVMCEKRQGKGNAIRSMFRRIDADIYVMVDGDGTYPADKVYELIKPIIEDEADMVVGSRFHNCSNSKFKPLNWLGNKFFLLVLNGLFRIRITDLLSGYRAFNKRVVKCLPVLSRGFEVETELTVKCIERGYRILEVPVSLSQRPEGSQSKIRVFKDGLLIFNTIFALLRDYKPLTAFGLLGLIFVLPGFIYSITVIREFLLTGYIHRIPLAILAGGLVLLGTSIIFLGLVLHTISKRFQEMDYQLQNLFNRIDVEDNKSKDG